jgi:hypothetical protein
MEADVDPARSGRRLLFAGLATAALLTSWGTAWLLPAPQTCVAISCGPHFNADAVTWRPLSFLNWPQLVVLILGVAIFGVLLVLAASAPTMTDSER